MKNVTDEMPELARVSSKGQVVIPQDIRSRLHIREGSLFAVSSINGDMLIMKKVENPVSREDLEIAAEINSAWKEIESGEFSESSIKDFKRELKDW